MNTPAHAVVNLCLLGRGRGAVDPTVPVLAGAILPDVPMVVFYAIQKLALGRPEMEIWSSTYFAPAWQALFDVFNSFPLMAVGALVARLAGSVTGGLVVGSMALHGVGDFLLHHDDAHRHFFPLSDWRFESPVSYWDPAHYGWISAPLEALVVLGGCALLLKAPGSWRRRMVAWGLLGVYAVYWGFVVAIWLPLA